MPSAGVWTTDHLVASAPILESTVVLSTGAAVTERVTVGFNVLVLALRPVAWAAKQIGALQYVSRDRLVVGVGTGNLAHGDAGWQAAGVPFADRGRRTDDALRVLPDLVAGAQTTLPDGTQVRLDPPATVPPVLVAGNGARARRRVAAYADGWISLGLPPEEVSAGLADLAELAAGHGRSAPSATALLPTVDADPARAAAQVADYAEAGASRVILAPTGADWRRDYEHAATIRAAL